MSATLSGMRIVALPLTASRGSRNMLPLIYYHFQTPPPNRVQTQNILNKITNKSAEAWASFGRAAEGSWKRTVFIYGEKLLNRVDFEELSLRGVDPSLGPRIGKTREESGKIPLFYPPSYDFGYGLPSSPLQHIQTILSKRNPQHKKGFYIWLSVAPLLMPLAIVPLVPNLPLFYAAWRAWSHYRAWKASEYLQGLIESNRVVPQPSPELGEIYASRQYPSTPQLTKNPKHSTIAEKSLGTDSKPYTFPRHDLLLDQEAVPQILKNFQLSETAGAEISKAIEQAKVRIRNDTIN